MRTKTLLLTAALVAVGAASSMAQVYSQNAVGYVNVTLAPGFNLIANPLNAAVNTLGALIPAAPDGAQFYKFTPGSGFATFTFDGLDNAWGPNGNVSLAPGEGGFLNNPTAGNVVVTFVGDVLQGTLNTSLPNGFSIASSKVPQTANVDALLLPPDDGDQLFKFVNPGPGYVTYTFDGLDNAWGPSSPVINVGESFFINKTVSRTWTRVFSVN